MQAWRALLSDTAARELAMKEQLERLGDVQVLPVEGRGSNMCGNVKGRKVMCGDVEGGEVM